MPRWDWSEIGRFIVPCCVAGILPLSLAFAADAMFGPWSARWTFSNTCRRYSDRLSYAALAFVAYLATAPIALGSVLASMFSRRL
jgi:hypothetical protein